MFYLNRDDWIVDHLLEILWLGNSAEALSPPRSIATHSGRGIAAGLYHGLGCCSRVDLWHDDARRCQIEHGFYNIEIVLPHAYERRRAGTAVGHDMLQHGLVVQRGVLHVEPGEIVFGLGDQFADGRVGKGHAHADTDFAGSESLPA